jgi:hypothetical protein
MSRGAQTFKQGDVTKALKGTLAAGFDVKRIEIDRDGKIVVITGQQQTADANSAANEWDNVK